MELSKAEEFAKQELRKWGLFEWRFKWIKSKRIFGSCSHTFKTIELSTHLTSLNKEKEVKDTILHEIAHALSPYNAGHNYIWKQNCIKVGVKAERCYDTNKIVTPEPNYNGLCRCNLKHRRYRRPRVNFICANCNSRIVWI